MSYTPLPPRPSLELLRKRAKRRLTDLRAASPEARLFDAQLQLAREHGFSSWRALKEQIDRVRREGRFRADGSPAHLPDETVINGWPDFTSERPLKVLVSGCLTGLPVGVEGKPYGEYPPIVRFLARPEVDAVTFCPEHFAFGTPRDCPDIHGGDGYDVLDGRARVLSEAGQDWTDAMVEAARQMLRIAQAHQARLALLQDISAACGSQVIYRGARKAGAPHQVGAGVCAALLIRNGIAVISQRDFKSFDLILRKLDPARSPRPDLRDQHQNDWYRTFFGGDG